MNDSLCVVAFTADGSDWTKVARTADAEASRKQIQEATPPFEVRLIKEYPDRGELETQVLKHLNKLAVRDRCMRGWYRVAPDSVVGLVDEILRSAPANPEVPTENPASQRMIMKTSYYPVNQLERLKKLSRKLEVPEAKILREALEARLLQAGL